MSRTVGSYGYGKAWGKIPEILPRPLGASDDDSEKRDSCVPQRPARRPELADMTSAEWTVPTAERREQNRSAAAILRQRYGTLDIGRRELEVWRRVAGSERGMCGICHLSTSLALVDPGSKRPTVSAARCGERSAKLRRANAGVLLPVVDEPHAASFSRLLGRGIR